MNILKKLSAVTLSLLMVFSISGCSDLSWAMKTENTTLPIGVYIFYMSSAYSEAYNQVPSDYLDVLDQKINDKEVPEFIKEKAMEYCKKLIEVEKEFEERGLTLTEEEQTQAVELTDAQWKQYGTIYEGFGVSKDSFHRASTMYSIKSQKLHIDIYGEDGTKKTTDEDIKNYYLDNYTSYSYIAKSLYTSVESEDTDEESGSTQTRSLTDEEVAEIENEFNGYVSDIENGDSIDSIDSKYKEKNNTDKGINTYEENIEESTMPDEVKNALKEMQNNTARAIKTTDSYYFVYKDDIANTVDKLSQEDLKNTVLSEMNGKEFDNNLIENANKLDIQVNQKAINKYQPEIFRRKTQ